MASLLSVALLAGVQAHICIISPHQRGPMNISDAGDHSCFRRTPSCGGMPAGAPSGWFKVNVVSAVLFQQNLNHWSREKPGFLDVAVSYDNETTWTVHKQFSDFPGNDMVQQTNFSINVVFTQPSEHAVLRVRYVSYNKDEVYPANNTDAIFYQCADIKIVADDNAPQPAELEEPKAQIGEAASCVTPSMWTATTESNLEKTKIWYDATAPLVRWDRTNLATGVTATFITNYTATSEGFLEYGIWEDTKTCLVYGADTFYPWGYTTEGTISCSADGNSEIMCSDATNGFRWRAQPLPNDPTKCLPMYFEKQFERIEFQAEQATSIDRSVFTIPSYCSIPTVQKISCHSGRY